MELGSLFLFLQEQIKDIIIIIRGGVMVTNVEGAESSAIPILGDTATRRVGGDDSSLLFRHERLGCVEPSTTNEGGLHTERI
jgi:hypothetical protein